MKITHRPKLAHPVWFALMLPLYFIFVLLGTWCGDRTDDSSWWFVGWLVMITAGGFCILGIFSAFTLVPRKDKSE